VSEISAPIYSDRIAEYSKQSPIVLKDVARIIHDELHALGYVKDA
jgi:hypothetical protein